MFLGVYCRRKGTRSRTLHQARVLNFPVYDSVPPQWPVCPCPFRPLCFVFTRLPLWSLWVRGAQEEFPWSPHHTTYRLSRIIFECEKLWVVSLGTISKVQQSRGWTHLAELRRQTASNASSCWYEKREESSLRNSMRASLLSPHCPCMLFVGFFSTDGPAMRSRGLISFCEVSCFCLGAPRD